MTIVSVSDRSAGGLGGHGSARGARAVCPRSAPVGGWGIQLTGTLLLAASRAFPLAPLVSWSSRSDAVHSTLHRTPCRLALSPVASVLEGLSLLPAQDHVTVVVSLIVLAAVLGA